MYTILTFLILIIFSVTIIFKVKANNYKSYNKSFISIEIQQGDTLSSIASEYAISSSQYQDYINEIKSINNLKSDRIHAGCYLLIPYYNN